MSGNAVQIVTMNDGGIRCGLNISDLWSCISGAPAGNGREAVAVVGRSCTLYGIKAAERLGYGLTRHGCPGSGPA